MIKIKRFYVVHEPNENFLKILSRYNVAEMAYCKKGTFFLAPKKGIF
jgi:hypothetical protein